ncbi:Threonine synthase [Candidatus Burkholderia verschuerenii]|uniref:Threonine synthase n=1 Tax=Candidatus Burkholderia verschuerenii TaxID=242163 RepID=A0A0L0MC45_9BURK|nr:pyridoxal-phosphate dependent enzyme [Candidatus Burkholderia verschuerenii]KND59918.1 Threonine synthase [Candidatus Burkholderia verschuerenii]
MKSHYVEPLSGTTYPLDTPRWCSDDRRPLLISPLARMSRDNIVRQLRSQWRYRASLPVEIVSPISMGEGCTPLIQKAWDDHRPHFKLEWFSPTSSFKDRGTTVMLSMLRQQGITSVLEDSSGNGGASVAAYGAAGAMRVKIVAPAHASPAKIAQMRAYGAEVQLVDGPRQTCEDEAVRQSASIFFANHNWQPFFLEGTKSVGYEIWEDLNFQAPDNIVMPAGAGSNVLGCYLAFSELMRAGQIQKIPKLFVCQPLNCSPIDASFQAGVTTPVAREIRKTVSEGTAIAHRLRPTEGAYTATLWFENGAFASLSYNGYAHFDSDEWVGWIGEMGRAKSLDDYGVARRKLARVQSKDAEARLKAAGTYAAMPTQPHRRLASTCQNISISARSSCRASTQTSGHCRTASLCMEMSAASASPSKHPPSRVPK